MSSLVRDCRPALGIDTRKVKSWVPFLESLPCLREHGPIISSHSSWPFISSTAQNLCLLILSGLWPSLIFLTNSHSTFQYWIHLLPCPSNFFLIPFTKFVLCEILRSPCTFLFWALFLLTVNVYFKTLCLSVDFICSSNEKGIILSIFLPLNNEQSAKLQEARKTLFEN